MGSWVVENVFGSPHLRGSRWGLGLVAALGVLVIGGAAALFKGGENKPKSLDVSLREATQIKAVTDRDHRIHLGALAEPIPVQDLARAEEELAWAKGLTLKAIALAAPDPSHNCHGWVFAGGRFWIPGFDVETILSDNGYSPVSAPRAGDLAVYRDADGGVVHSGVVRSTAGDILVESKWGPLGRFIHRADDQPYGGRCIFYSGPRPEHRLRGIAPDSDHADPFLTN